MPDRAIAVVIFDIDGTVAERLAQIATAQEILLVVDDDDLVVAALRDAGWPVQHAQWMPL